MLILEDMATAPEFLAKSQPGALSAQREEKRSAYDKTYTKACLAQACGAAEGRRSYETPQKTRK